MAHRLASNIARHKHSLNYLWLISDELPALPLSLSRSPSLCVLWLNLQVRLAIKFIPANCLIFMDDYKRLLSKYLLADRFKITIEREAAGK